MALEDTGTLANALTRFGCRQGGSQSLLEFPAPQYARQMAGPPSKKDREDHRILCLRREHQEPTTNCVMQVLREWLIWAVLWWTGSVERMRWIVAYDAHLALIRVRDAK